MQRRYRRDACLRLTLYSAVTGHSACMSYHPSIAETLAEELVSTRAQLTTLKQREGELRDALLSLAGPGAAPVNIPTLSSVVRIERRVSKRFDANRLPDHIRDDARYKAEKEVVYVRVLNGRRGPHDPTATAQQHTVIELDMGQGS